MCFYPGYAEYRYIEGREGIKIKFFAEREGKILNFKKNIGRIVSKRGRGGRFLHRIIALLICIVIFSVSLMGVYRKAEPLAVGALENVVGGWIEQIVVEAVRSSTREKSYKWSDFCIKTLGNDGSIVSISANTENIGVLCADVTAKINRAIKDEKSVKISLPLGSVLAPKYFSGRGPYLKVRAVPYVSVSVSVSSEMHESGINQTLHRINMTVISDISAICMSSSVTFVRESKILLAESLIIGKIPVVA